MVNNVGNAQLIQRINRIKVLDYMRKYGPSARTRIAEHTNLSLSSITNITNYLLSRSLLLHGATITSKTAGRRASLIEFNASAMQIVAVNVEPDCIELALCDLDGKAIATERIIPEHFHDADSVLGAIETKIRAILPQAANPVAIGIAVNGHVEGERGIVTSSIMRWKDVRVGEFFRKRFDGLHVYVTNNSKTKARWQIKKLGEAAAENLIFLDLTSGVGIISFYGGKLNESVAGELGHTTVMKDGPMCFCGNRGCLELVCSVEYILSRCREAYSAGGCKWMQGMETLSFSDAISAFESGDAQVRDIFHECAEYLGIAIANIISIFEPKIIVINGDKLTRCDFIYQTACDEAERRTYSMSITPNRYERVEITAEQALAGAAQYVADCLFALDGPEDII